VEYCQIVNVSSTVNCRAGPGTGYASKGSIPNGVSFHFSCYKRGECVNGNWSVERFYGDGERERLMWWVRSTWDYAVDYQCYINGYYTSSQCTIGKFMSLRYWFGLTRGWVLMPCAGVANLGPC
jgi:hypothetical protein